jgi:hypothetical protein
MILKQDGPVKLVVIDTGKGKYYEVVVNGAMKLSTVIYEAADGCYYGYKHFFEDNQLVENIGVKKVLQDSLQELA